MTLALLAVAVVVASATVDFAHARYVQAMVDHRIHAAARWSVAQWCAASVGFVVAVRVSLWMLPFEAFGLYVGTLLGAQRRGDQPKIPEARIVRTRSPDSGVHCA